MSSHRLNENDQTMLLPATVEELAAQERARGNASGFRRRPVLLTAAAAGMLAFGAVGWMLAGPSSTPAPLGLPATSAEPHDAGFVDGFGGNLATARPSGTGRPLPTLSATPVAGTPTVHAAASTTPTPAGLTGSAAAPGPLLGTSVLRSLQSVSRPELFVHESNGYADLDRVTAASAASTRQDATFQVVAGLIDPGCYSFVLADGRYLRHRDYRIRIEPNDSSVLFRSDATFCARPGPVAGSVLLEPVNYPGYLLHRRGSRLWIDSYQDSVEFRADCALRVVDPLG